MGLAIILDVLFRDRPRMGPFIYTTFRHRDHSDVHCLTGDMLSLEGSGWTYTVNGKVWTEVQPGTYTIGNDEKEPLIHERPPVC